MDLEKQKLSDEMMENVIGGTAEDAPEKADKPELELTIKSIPLRNQPPV